MKRRSSAAITVAALALIAAVAGTALAGSGPGANSSASTKKTATKALKLAKKNKKKIKNVELTPGPKGADGQDGADGADGAENAASFVTGRAEPLPAMATTHYYPPSGADAGDPVESLAATLAPNQATIVEDLAVKVNIPLMATTMTFTLRADGAAGLTCQILINGTTCTSANQSMPVPAGAELALEVVAAAGPQIATRAHFGYRVDSM